MVIIIEPYSITKSLLDHGYPKVPILS